MEFNERTIQPIINFFIQEYRSFFLWSPIFLIIGILLFFALDFEPNIIITTIIVIMLSIYSYIYKKPYITVVLCISIGFLSIVIRTYYIQSPKIEQKLENIWLSGKIENIEHLSTGLRITIERIRIYKYNKAIPKKIRINVRTKVPADIALGDVVGLRATLMPIPKPVINDSFDFEKFAFFKQVGAIGFATSKVFLKKKNTISSITIKIDNIRSTIIDNIKSNMTKDTASIAMSLLVGETSSVNKKLYSSIRNSGIAHLLAISGMHMAIVVMIFFFSCKYILTLSSYITLRFDCKKISAFVAIIGSFAYLLITGIPVSAKRAFIMSSLFLTAIIIERESNPMQAIAIAAIIILILWPESVLNAGFQMSFIASLSLIYGFKKIIHKKGNKILVYFKSVFIATVIAGLTTAPLAIYHFHVFSTYSILTNLIAVPLTSFIIMPLGILTIIMIPLGFNAYIFKLIEKSIDLIIFTAKWVNLLPKAVIYLPTLTNLSINIVIFSLLFITISQAEKIKKYAYIAILISLTSLYMYKKPDIIVNDKIFAVKDINNILYISSGNNARFSRQIWTQVTGQKNMLNIKKSASLRQMNCNKDICFYKKWDKKVIITAFESIQSIQNLCSQADLIILQNSEFICPNTQTINLNQLKKYGTSAIWLDSMKIKFSNKKPLRLWQMS